MLAVALGLLAVLAGSQSGTAPRIAQISCFDDQSVVGLTSAHQFVTWEGSTWRVSTVVADRLWHSPDDRVFVVGAGPFVQEIVHGTNLSATRWILPPAARLPRIAFLDGIVAVTATRMFRLDSAGKTMDIGATPMAPDQVARIPAVIAAAGRFIACYPTSFSENDAGQGACIATPPGAYRYLVDFGDFTALTQRRFVAPFVCGRTIVSAHGGLTQFRDLVTGKPVAQIAGAAREGSGCIAGARAVLVGKDDVRIAAVQNPRNSWREAVAGDIAAAAICGKRLVFVRSGQSVPSFVDLPTMK